MLSIFNTSQGRYSPHEQVLFPANDLSSVLIPAGVRRRPCHQSRVELISIDWIRCDQCCAGCVPAVCRLRAGCLNASDVPVSTVPGLSLACTNVKALPQHCGQQLLYM